ncbi:MAG: hypothetical protein A2234_02350 [Elusimicrobia bacterium RIFOXYA2_FULL_58_8]|nr:MAG: hypothetical protein A2285_02315 [Elusimicrobia bacterium RIFOXYA12_FULL_57_11]OGS13154.1 MAG: hypothetical protein A2234_02350 [Elusimicrobia bacterium RIFOXYA2_FULL_58_8]
MNTDQKMSALEDVWLQVFALLLIVSGIFSLHYMLRPAQAMPLPAQTALPLPARPVQTGGGAPPTEVPPETTHKDVSAAAAQLHGTAAETPAPPKAPGRWVVGSGGGPGVNYASLGEAVARAADGDTITLRPGTYEVSALTSKSLTISGEGRSPEEVELTNSLNPTFAIAGGRVVMENLSIANTSQVDYWALSVSRAALVLRNVNVKSSGKGVKVLDAELEASDCEFESSAGLSVSGKSRVKLSGVSVTGRVIGISVQDPSADLQLGNSHISGGGGAGLRVSDGAWARVSGTTIANNRYAGIMVASGAEVRVSKSQLTGNGECGAYIEENGKLIMEKVTLTRNKCGVGFAGGGTLEVRGNKFSENSMGAVAVSPLQGDKALITGGGNSGLLVPGEKRPAAKKRAPAAEMGTGSRE